MNIIEYLASKKIIVNENKFKDKHFAKNYDDISNQLKIMNNCHKNIAGERGTIIPRINSTIGKELECFKVWIKKVSTIIEFIESISEENEYLYFIAEEGKRIKVRAEKSLNILNIEGYYRLIHRSMDNYEITLGRTDEGNLKINEDGVINIRTVKYVSYNLIEQDCYNYIKRIRRKVIGIDWSKIIDLYIEEAKLGYDSKNYLLALANYPIDEIKLLLKFKANRTENSDKKWAEELLKAKIFDGKIYN